MNLRVGILKVRRSDLKVELKLDFSSLKVGIQNLGDKGRVKTA